MWRDGQGALLGFGINKYEKLSCSPRSMSVTCYLFQVFLTGIPRIRSKCGRQEVVISMPQQHKKQGKRKATGHCDPTPGVPALAAALKYMTNQASALMQKAQPAIFCAAYRKQARYFQIGGCRLSKLSAGVAFAQLSQD